MYVCLTHIFSSILYLSLVPSKGTALFCVSTTLHSSWTKQIALFLKIFQSLTVHVYCLLKNLSKILLPCYFWPTKNKPVQQLHGKLLEEMLRMAMLWLVQWNRQNSMQLRSGGKKGIPSLLPHKKATIFISSILSKVLVSFDFFYSFVFVTPRFSYWGLLFECHLKVNNATKVCLLYEWHCWRNGSNAGCNFD